MNITQKIINDIKNLRGANVRIFGQPTTLPTAVDDFTIDIIDILNDLQDYEIELGDYTVYDEESDDIISLFDSICDNYCDSEVDADLIIEELENAGYLTTCDSTGYNSYNWYAPITNSFAFEIYKDVCCKGVYVRFMVHRFGDVRCNYTDAAIYHFDDECEFFEILSDTSKNIEIDIDGKTYDIVIDVLHDGFEVFDNDDYSYVCTIYGVDDAAEASEEIKKKL